MNVTLKYVSITVLSSPYLITLFFQLFLLLQVQNFLEELYERVMNNAFMRRLELLDYIAISIAAVWARDSLAGDPYYIYSLAYLWYDFTFAYGICGILSCSKNYVI